MVKSFSTPAGSPTVNFGLNTKSPIVAFDSGTPNPVPNNAAITFSSAKIIYPDSKVVH